MRIAVVDSLARPCTRIYFYYFTTVLLLGALLMDEVSVVDSVAAVMGDDRQVYGTVLYNRSRLAGRCFNPEDPKLIEAKLIFQDLMPYRKKRFEPLTDDIVRSLLMYFSSVSVMVDKLVTTDDVISAAWYDTAGDYLNGYLLPVSKYCFYSGNVSYDSVRSVLNFHGTVKRYLDTNGMGWSRPTLDTDDVQSKIQPLKSYKNVTSCTELAFNTSVDITLPRAEFDDESQALISLWFPLRSRQVYDPRTKSSLSIMRTYFETVLQCIPQAKLKKANFSTRSIEWINGNLAKRLMDEEFYPGLESIFRIKKTLEADATSKLLTKKSITEEEEGNDESTSDSKGFLERLFGSSDPSSDGPRNDEDEADAEEQRWLRIKTIVAAVTFPLAMLILIVCITVKMRLNRKAKKRKAAVRQEYFRPWERRRFSKRGADQHSDEEVLLTMEKQAGKRDPSETSESGWRHVKPSTTVEKNHRKPRNSKQLPPFSDNTEDDDEFQAFQMHRLSTEKVPLVVKETKKKKTRCGRGCFCMACVKKQPRQSLNSNQFQDLPAASVYETKNEKPDQKHDAGKARESSFFRRN